MRPGIELSQFLRVDLPTISLALPLQIHFITDKATVKLKNSTYNNQEEPARLFKTNDVVS